MARDPAAVVADGLVAEPLPAPTALAADDRHRILQSLISVVGGVYAHLPQKQATYGADPVQQLRALVPRVDALTSIDFDREINRILVGLRDAHTRYVHAAAGPARIAVLPLLIERCVQDGDEVFVASKLFGGDPIAQQAMADAGLVEGCRITHWNGVPIAAAIDRYADEETGGRRDARRARALESLTVRPLRYAAPPQEDWVRVTFVNDDDGAEGEVRLVWQVDRVDAVGDGGDRADPDDDGSPGTLAVAVDPLGEAARRVKKMLFSPAAFVADVRPLQLGVIGHSADAAAATFADAVTFDTIPFDGDEYAYMRIWSFDVADDVAFVNHVADELDQRPQGGVVIDLRSNPGGLIWAAERLLQLFTPHRVEPCRFSMLASDVTRAMVEAPQNSNALADWRSSLERAVTSGEAHSREVPLTPVERCNDIGQRYPGPVVIVVDANTYSAGDLFAAGVADNSIGSIVATDEATGAGGANVWSAAQLRRALAGTPFALPALPGGVEFTISIRRAVRAGERQGIGIEDRGVAANFVRPLTRDDILNSNVDLKTFCARLLSRQRRSDLQVEFETQTRAVVTGAGVDRLAVYADGLPVGPAIDLVDGRPQPIDLPATWDDLVVAAYSGAVLRQRRRLRPEDVGR